MPDNGVVERLNGRVQREMLGITIYSHQDLGTLLKCFKQAYNRRRQRVLKWRSPDEVVHSRLAAEPKLANRRYKPPNSHALPPALRVVARARCSIPGFDGAILSLEWRDALWAKYSMGAP